MQRLVGSKIYISGPMKGLPDHGRPIFTDVCRALRAQGWHVVSPHEIVPTTETLEQAEDPAFYAECLRLDLIDMLNCDAICLLDNWWQSRGAMVELNAAVSAGLKVVRYNGVEVVPA